MELGLLQLLQSLLDSARGRCDLHQLCAARCGYRSCESGSTNGFSNTSPHGIPGFGLFDSDDRPFGTDDFDVGFLFRDDEVSHRPGVIDFRQCAVVCFARVTTGRP